MVREGDPRCLSAELRRDPSLHSLKRDEPNAPACPALRWRTADHRNDRGLLRAVEQRHRLGARIVTQRMLEPARQVTLSDPRRLSSIATDRLRCRGHGVASVEQEQRPHSAPRSRAHRRATGQHLFQARAIILGELEPRESRCRRHLKL